MSCPLRAEKAPLPLTEQDRACLLTIHNELSENLEDPHLAGAKLQHN